MLKRIAIVIALITCLAVPALAQEPNREAGNGYWNFWVASPLTFTYVASLEFGNCCGVEGNAISDTSSTFRPAYLFIKATGDTLWAEFFYSGAMPGQGGYPPYVLPLYPGEDNTFAAKLLDSLRVSTEGPGAVFGAQGDGTVDAPGNVKIEARP